MRWPGWAATSSSSRLAVATAWRSRSVRLVHPPARQIVDQPHPPVRVWCRDLGDQRRGGEAGVAVQEWQVDLEDLADWPHARRRYAVAVAALFGLVNDVVILAEDLPCLVAFVGAAYLLQRGQVRVQALEPVPQSLLPVWPVRTAAPDVQRDNAHLPDLPYAHHRHASPGLPRAGAPSSRRYYELGSGLAQTPFNPNSSRP